MISSLRDIERLSNLPISNSLGSRARIQTKLLSSRNLDLNLCTILSFKFCEIEMQSHRYLKESSVKNVFKKKEGEKERETGIARCR